MILAENNNDGYVDKENGIKNAVITAREYGTSKGVTGRLLTKAEADEMDTSAYTILYGTWTGDDKCVDDQGLFFWIGAVGKYNSQDVYNEYVCCTWAHPGRKTLGHIL